MIMDIERVLKEKFGDAFKEIHWVFNGDQPAAETTSEVSERTPPL
jgi:NFU1 iron-sulfur cluster scaffold homolog, mitochondrial